MSRRVSLPGADELFRPTREREAPRPEPRPRHASTRAEVPRPTPPLDPPREQPREQPEQPEQPSRKGPSGRIRHDEKITVYVTADELHDLEDTRLKLRREHGLAVDRGRLVREAIHLALEGVEALGEDSPLVRRLREQ